MQCGVHSKHGLPTHGNRKSWNYLQKLLLACFLFVCLGTALQAKCAPRDFLSIPLPAPMADPVHVALTHAYPDVTIPQDGLFIRVNNGLALELRGPPVRSPAERLANATIADQFAQTYPLDFDLKARSSPWFDPGRARNDAFFRALWFADRQAAEASLVQVAAPRLGNVIYSVTAKRNVACQLATVLDALSNAPEDLSYIFASAAGGFNWRLIAGTDRLSAHSFGIAVDVNAEIGQYWKWTGAPEGRVGAYHNRIPPHVVQAFERYGFIWGGKWHHFDGMHFEYRPELILHARLVEGGRH